MSLVTLLNRFRLLNPPVLFAIGIIAYLLAIIYIANTVRV